MKEIDSTENSNNCPSTPSPLLEEYYTKIIICPICSGSGFTQTYNDREQCYDRKICSFCNGDKVVQKIIHIHYEKSSSPPP